MTVGTATDVLVAPAFHSVPPHAVDTFGDSPAEFAANVGRPVDPEQRLAIDAFCSVDASGAWAAFESCIVEGRQNGKTERVILPVVLDDLFFGPPDRIVWTAHRFRIARASFVECHAVIDQTPALSKRVKKINESHGEESIELQNGALLEFLARSKGVGRGLGGKLIVFDEALYLEGAAMGALLPTLSARRNTRILYGSSAGVAESSHLRAMRDRGRAGGDPSLAYLEWCSPEGGCQFGEQCPHTLGTPGCKLDDESLWPLANHAMARGRITVESVRNERRAMSMSPAEFKRERLGWWDDPAATRQPIGSSAWAALSKPRRRRPADAVPVFFVHVTQDQSAAAIAAAYTVRGRPHVELADYRLGTSWLADRCGQLKRKFPRARWAVEDGGAVGSELPELRKQRVRPKPFGAKDMGYACGHLQQLVKDHGFTHSGDAAFAVAVQGAVRRDVAERLWVFSPRQSSVDVSPLVSAAGVLWLLETWGPAPPADIL